MPKTKALVYGTNKFEPTKTCVCVNCYLPRRRPKGRTLLPLWKPHRLLCPAKGQFPIVEPETSVEHGGVGNLGVKDKKIARRKLPYYSAGFRVQVYAQNREADLTHRIRDKGKLRLCSN